MSDDALERLKKRQRPTVPSRDASITTSSIDASVSKNADIVVSNNLDNVISSSADIPTSRQPDIDKPTEPELQTKQTTLRLEAGISDRLMVVTRSSGISREVLIEALFEHYEADPQAWGEILAEAKKRAEQRTKLANIKRAKSMMQRFC